MKEGITLLTLKDKKVIIKQYYEQLQAETLGADDMNRFLERKKEKTT